MQYLDGTFSFSETIRAAARWRSAALIVAGAVIGALAGWVFLLAHPPVYEAEATLRVEIDLSHTGELSIIEEDHVLGVVAALVSSTQVHEEVAAAARAEGIDVSLTDLETGLLAERFFGEWTLRVRHEDADTAARLAQLWGESALETLQTAGGYARQVDALYRRDDSYENCFKGSPLQPVHAFCRTLTWEEIETGSSGEIGVIHRQKQASQGVISGLSFQLAGQAQTKERPVLYDPVVSLAAAALAGTLTAAALLFFWEVRRGAGG